MKLMVVALLAIIGMAAASANVVPSGSAPVDRVVVLLKTLQETVTKDGETDTLIYNRNACWCETTATQKAKDIENANDDMRKLGQTILKLKGVVATKAAVIEEYNGLIRGTKDEQAEATALRQKENGEHAAESRETEEALASLEKAIKTLADATNTGATGAKALLQSSEQMESRNAVADVLERLPSRIPSLSASLKSFAGVALLSEFVKAKAGYAPQSATIQGMLGDMYTTFATNLEAGTELEANRNSNLRSWMPIYQRRCRKKRILSSRTSKRKPRPRTSLLPLRPHMMPRTSRGRLTLLSSTKQRTIARPSTSSGTLVRRHAATKSLALTRLSAS